MKIDYNHKFNFGNFFSCSVKLQKNLKLKYLDRNLVKAIKKVLFEKLYTLLTLLMMGLFGGMLIDWGNQKDPPL